MKARIVPIFWGIVLLLLGAGLLIATNLGKIEFDFDQISDWGWIIVSAVLSVLFLFGYFIAGVKNWGWLFPAFIFTAITITLVLAINDVEGSWMGFPILIAIALPFYIGFVMDTKNVWLLFPAIILTGISLVTLVADSDISGEWMGAVVLYSEPFSAHCFKIMTDPFVGHLTFCLIYLGCLKKGQYAYNTTKDKRERVSHILKMHANKREEVEEALTGDIVALTIKNTATGDTLCDEKRPIVLEKITLPETVISIAIETKSQADQGKLSEALHKIALEDPSFRVHTDSETGQTIISGMGELHLEIIVDRLVREFKVEAHVGKPQVAYKTTVTALVQAEGMFIRQSGGRGQYGHVLLEIEPLARGTGIEFVDKQTASAEPCLPFFISSALPPRHPSRPSRPSLARAWSI